MLIISNSTCRPRPTTAVLGVAFWGGLINSTSDKRFASSWLGRVSLYTDPVELFRNDRNSKSGIHFRSSSRGGVL